MVRQFCQFNNFEYEIDELEKKVSVIRPPPHNTSLVNKAYKAREWCLVLVLVFSNTFMQHWSTPNTHMDRHVDIAGVWQMKQVHSYFVNLYLMQIASSEMKPSD